MPADLHFASGRPGDNERWCCMGAVSAGRCTCWEPVYDTEQAPEIPNLRPVVRPTPCSNCACRGDKRGADDYDAALEDMRRRAAVGKPFYCHAGMRMVLAHVHPDGSRIETGDEWYFDAPWSKAGHPLKTDGSPADLCTGWAAMAGRKGGDEVAGG